MGTARVGADIATERTHLLAGGVGSKMNAIRCQGTAEVQVDHARLHPGHPLIGINRHQTVHFRGDHHKRLIQRHRPTGQPSPGTPGNHRPAMTPRRVNAALHLSVLMGKHTGPALPPSKIEASRPMIVRSKGATLTRSGDNTRRRSRNRGSVFRNFIHQ